MNRSFRIIALGLLLMLAAWLALFLTTLRQIPPNLFVLLAAYAGSLVGFVVGLVGLAEYVRTHPS